MSLARAVAWNTAVQVGGRALGLIAAMAFTRIIVHDLGIETYGQFIAASAYVGLFMILGESGLYLVAVRRAMQEHERRSAILGTALGLRLLWSVVPLGLAFVCAQLIPSERFPTYEPVVKLAIGILALNEYFRLLGQFLTAVFRMHLRMDLAIIGEVGSRFVALAGVLVVAATGGGLLALAVAVTCASIVNLVYAWIVTRRFETFNPRLDRTLVRELVREAVVVAAVLVLSLLRGQLGTLLLSLLRSAEDVGIYGVAQKVHEVLISFPGLFIALLYPVFSRLAAEDREQLRRMFQRTFDVMLLASVAAALTVFVLAPQVAAILGEPRAATPMRFLAFALPPVFLAMSFSHLLLAEGRQALIVRLYALLVAVNFTLHWIFIPRYSYLATASVNVVTEVLAMASMGFYWIAVRRMRLQLRSLWSIPLAVVLGAILLAGIRRWVPAEETSMTVRLVAVAASGLATAGSYAGAVLGLRLVPMQLVRTLLPGTARPEGPASAEST
ncbi:MAG: flippase [Candidatus Krumholzibacteriia bacterium]